MFVTMYEATFTLFPHCKHAGTILKCKKKASLSMKLLLSVNKKIMDMKNNIKQLNKYIKYSLNLHLYQISVTSRAKKVG